MNPSRLLVAEVAGGGRRRKVASARSSRSRRSTETRSRAPPARSARETRATPSVTHRGRAVLQPGRFRRGAPPKGVALQTQRLRAVGRGRSRSASVANERFATLARTGEAVRSAAPGSPATALATAPTSSGSILPATRPTGICSIINVPGRETSVHLQAAFNWRIEKPPCYTHSQRTPTGGFVKFGSRPIFSELDPRLSEARAADRCPSVVRSKGRYTRPGRSRTTSSTRDVWRASDGRQPQVALVSWKFRARRVVLRRASSRRTSGRPAVGRALAQVEEETRTGTGGGGPNTATGRPTSPSSSRSSSRRQTTVPWVGGSCLTMSTRSWMSSRGPYPFSTA